jgi:hypothetical protein
MMSSLVFARSNARLLAEVVAFQPVLAKQILRRDTHFRPPSYLDTLAKLEELCEPKGIP